MSLRRGGLEVPFACQQKIGLLAPAPAFYHSERTMSVDDKTVRRIATLARIALADGQVAPMAQELNGILSWIEQLKEIDIEGVPPMTSVVEQRLRMREDIVGEGNEAEALMRNAPEAEDHFFVVPKVVE
jgi:aspartyl-tRNA(Asn)/glutamyl-tRNA(Gln) amidotransferase subunit C